MSRPLILRKEIARLLKQRGMTGAELARQCELSRQVLSDWMAGVSPRNLTQLKKVADALGVSMDELCFGPCLQAVEDGPDWIVGRFEGRIKKI